jgi:uncharacterized protein
MTVPVRKISIVLVGVLCSCSIFPPGPAPNFFVLSSEADTAESNMNASGPSPALLTPIQLGLGPIRFPDYLDRLEVVTRIDDNRVAISETDRWAAPLGSAFARVLAQDLSARVPDSHVALYPWYHDHEPDFQIVVDVQRFDVTVRGLANLQASWTISDLKAKAGFYSATSDVRESVGDLKSADPAAALSRIIADFSTQIAFRMNKLRR